MMMPMTTGSRFGNNVEANPGRGGTTQRRDAFYQQTCGGGGDMENARAGP